MMIKSKIIILIALLSPNLNLFTQDSITPQIIDSEQVQIQRIYNSAGLDILVSTSGIGLGIFYRYEYNDDFAFYCDFSISESKADEEEEMYDPYLGIYFTPGKVNRFLVLPLFLGVQKRLFAEEIVDNFRPFINGAIGPSMIYVFPYRQDFFTDLGKGHPEYTIGGYVGFGAYFGKVRSALFGINLRVYLIPHLGSGIESMRYRDRVDSKKQFGGFFITMSWGGGW